MLLTGTKLDIRYFSVIYDLTDDIKDLLSGLLAPEKEKPSLVMLKFWRYSISARWKGCGLQGHSGIGQKGFRGKIAA